MTSSSSDRHRCCHLDCGRCEGDVYLGEDGLEKVAKIFGCHVKYGGGPEGTENIYWIVPMCQRHNNQKESAFKIEKGTVLVSQQHS